MRLIDFQPNPSSDLPLTEQIVGHFEREILSGRIPKNYRLPNAQLLAEKWGCGYVTAHRALGRLAERGLARRAPNKGTYLNAGSVMRTVGVLVGPSLADPSAAFYRSLLSGIEKIVGARGEWPPPYEPTADTAAARRWTVRAYDALKDSDLPVAAHPQVHNLLLDLESHDFAGFIELGIDASQQNALAKAAEKPVAGLSSSRQSCLSFDLYHFGFESVRELARQGARRIVYFRTHKEGHGHFHDCNGVLDAAAAHGLPLPAIRQLHPDSARTGQIFEAEAHEAILAEPMPDAPGEKVGIVVSDDVAARGVSLGLLQRGIYHKGRAELLTWSNEGIDYYYGMPVTCYQIPTSRIVAHLLDTLWRKITGVERVEPTVFRGTLARQPITPVHKS